MLYALVSANYSGEDFYELTFPMLEALLKHIPLLEYRRAYPTAALHAAVMNLMGGRYKAGQAPVQTAKELEDAGKKEFFAATDFLPVYARPAGFMPADKPQISARAAQDFLAHDTLIPTWVLSVIDVKTIAAIAKGG